MYRIDLAEACWGEHSVGLRRLKLLVDGLGPHTNLARDLDPSPGAWEIRDELLACLIEATQGLAVMVHHAWFEPPHPKVERVPRPGVERASQDPVNRGDFRRALLGGG